jgi:hypothetical protein
MKLLKKEEIDDDSMRINQNIIKAFKTDKILNSEGSEELKPLIILQNLDRKINDEREIANDQILLFKILSLLLYIIEQEFKFLGNEKNTRFLFFKSILNKILTNKSFEGEYLKKMEEKIRSLIEVLDIHLNCHTQGELYEICINGSKKLPLQNSILAMNLVYYYIKKYKLLYLNIKYDTHSKKGTSFKKNSKGTYWSDWVGTIIQGIGDDVDDDFLNSTIEEMTKPMGDKNTAVLKLAEMLIKPYNKSIKIIPPSNSSNGGGKKKKKIKSRSRKSKSKLRTKKGKYNRNRTRKGSRN